MQNRNDDVERDLERLEAKQELRRFYRRLAWQTPLAILFFWLGATGGVASDSLPVGVAKVLAESFGVLGLLIGFAISGWALLGFFHYIDKHM